MKSAHRVNFSRKGFVFLRCDLLLEARIVSWIRWNPRSACFSGVNYGGKNRSSLSTGEKKGEFREPSACRNDSFISPPRLSTCLHTPASRARNIRATPTLFRSRHTSRDRKENREERWPSTKILPAKKTSLYDARILTIFDWASRLF